MAPPKNTTLVANNTKQQQHLHQQQQQQQQQQAKPRKRKAQQVNNAGKQQVGSKEPAQVVAANPAVQKQAPLVQVQIVPAEQTARTTAQSKQQVPSIVREPKVIADKKGPISKIGKQFSTEETDDIDAGIELDGSSNSGSSVKDMGDDQLKSASSSPVMAPQQQATPGEPSVDNKQLESVVPVVSVKKTTKQQLAANQEVIDADEQLLQQKLQKDKQKSGQEAAGERKPDVKSVPAPFKRRFSSQSSTESQSGSETQSVCKVCSQHVYQMERMLAEKSIYHKRCFRCFQCKIQLRVDSYSSHEGQVYCKTHHRQLFQPQVKLDNEEDVDIVAKSTSQTVDDYLLHRGRLSELSFLFLQPKAEGARQRQMIICENEPKELPKDVVRSDTKLDDGIEQLNLNLGNILQKFERGQANNADDIAKGDSPPSSAGVVIEKPSINIKQTLKAFESRLSDSVEAGESADKSPSKPVVRKLANINEMFLKRDSESQATSAASKGSKPQPMRRSESLMLRLKKYESRIAGEEVPDDEDADEEELELDQNGVTKQNGREKLPKKLTSINLSSLKNQWENGDINNNNSEDDDDDANDSGAADCQTRRKKLPLKASGSSAVALEIAALRRQHKSSTGDIGDEEVESTKSPVLEKEEELCRIRQQLASKKVGGASVRNIYENAIKEAQEHTNQSINKSRRDSSDLSALNGTIKTNEIQQQLLKQVKTSYNSNDNTFDTTNDANNQQQPRTPTTPKDHFQLNLTNRANKLKERFELGLINNSSRDDSDADSDEEQISKLEQIRQEKMEDLSIFTEGEIKAREARSLFQQIDRRISAAAAAATGNGAAILKPVPNSRSLASIGASMRAKLTNQMNGVASQPNEITKPEHHQQQQIRLTNNVKT